MSLNLTSCFWKLLYTNWIHNFFFLMVTPSYNKLEYKFTKKIVPFTEVFFQSEAICLLCKAWNNFLCLTVV